MEKETTISKTLLKGMNYAQNKGLSLFIWQVFSQELFIMVLIKKRMNNEKEIVSNASRTNAI